MDFYKNNFIKHFFSKTWIFIKKILRHKFFIEYFYEGCFFKDVDFYNFLKKLDNFLNVFYFLNVLNCI